MQKSITRLVVCVLLVFATASMSSAASMQPSLYDRLGGLTGIKAVVDQFVANVGADQKINKFFTATVADPQRLATFKMNLVNQICQGTGGPCKYTGKSMKDAHKGMGITDADFNALVGDLVAALNKFKVSAQNQKDLLALLGPMKGDIVGQ